MDLDLNEEQKLIQETARDFARAHLEPVAAELDQNGDHAVFLDNLKKLAALGFMGPAMGPTTIRIGAASKD